MPVGRLGECLVHHAEAASPRFHADECPRQESGPKGTPAGHYLAETSFDLSVTDLVLALPVTLDSKEDVSERHMQEGAFVGFAMRDELFGVVHGVRHVTRHRFERREHEQRGATRVDVRDLGDRVAQLARHGCCLSEPPAILANEHASPEDDAPRVTPCQHEPRMCGTHVLQQIPGLVTAFFRRHEFAGEKLGRCTMVERFNEQLRAAGFIGLFASPSAGG
jgi:hypothetical protein